jgi:hypothetical protein
MINRWAAATVRFFETSYRMVVFAFAMSASPRERKSPSRPGMSERPVADIAHVMGVIAEDLVQAATSASRLVKR